MTTLSCNGPRRPRSLLAGAWKVTLHPPVVVHRGRREDHITRPNMVNLDGATCVLFQTTFDTSATPHDCRSIALSVDGGESWRLAASDVNIGSYAMGTTDSKQAVVMPYDSIRFGATRQSLTGPRVTLAYSGGELRMVTDTTVAEFPAPLKGFLAEPILDTSGQPLYLAEDIPPADKPITSFWGNIRSLPDGRWIAPMYGCYESDPFARNSPAPEMRRMARFTSELFASTDHGRHWSRHARIATPRDVPDHCVEGPSETHLFTFPNLWRAVFRTSALKGFFAPMHFSDSLDEGRTWCEPKPLPGVEMIMDPRGLQLPDGVTVLSAGRPKVELYLAANDEPAFHPVGLTAHHNLFHPPLRTTGHTDVIALTSRRLLVVYDSIPDGWRWPGTPFTAPDAVYAVRIDIDET